MLATYYDNLCVLVICRPHMPVFSKSSGENVSSGSGHVSIMIT